MFLQAPLSDVLTDSREGVDRHLRCWHWGVFGRPFGHECKTFHWTLLSLLTPFATVDKPFRSPLVCILRHDRFLYSRGHPHVRGWLPQARQNATGRIVIQYDESKSPDAKTLAPTTSSWAEV